MSDFGWQDMFKGAMRCQMIGEIIQHGHTLELDIQPEQIELQYREQSGQIRLAIDYDGTIVDGYIYWRDLLEGYESSCNRWKFINSTVELLVAPPAPMSKADIIMRREEALKMRYPLVRTDFNNGPLIGCCR